MNEKHSVDPNMQYSKEAYNMTPHQAYNVGQPQSVVVHGQPSETIWTWCHLVTSVISIFLCSCFGIPATVMSLLAYSEHSANLHEKSRQKRGIALGLGIAGIVVGSILIILMIAVFSGYIVALTDGGY